MDRSFLRYVGVLLMIATTGCSMCDNSLDNTFGAYGGRWERTDPYCGRVASVIDPAGVNVAGPRAIESQELGQGDDDRESVLTPGMTEQADEEPASDIQPDAMPIDQPQDEPADGATGSEPATDTTEQEAAPSIELPDFFKELGLDSDPSPSAGTIEDLLPSDDSDSGLPPLRTDTDQ